jgi:hypothetical protein
MLAGAAIGFFSPSGVSAAPANGAAISEAATAAQMIEKAQCYRRHPRRRARYYSYRPRYYSYPSYVPSDVESLHQLSEENQQRRSRTLLLGTEITAFTI